MRMFFSRRRWMSVGIMCLSASSMIGCRSPGAGPGMGWFGWMNPKPSTALASNPPTKPSLANLPTPSATTGAATQAQAGSNSPVGAYAAANASHNHSHSHGHSHGTPSTPASYSTGPYGMASGSGASAGGSTGLAGAYGAGTHAASGHSAAGHSAAGHSHSHGAYAGTATQPAASGPSYGGYQSPYGNSAARTADARSPYGTADNNAPRYGAAPAAQNNYASQPWTPPANAGALPSGPAAGTPASYTDYSAASRGYGEPTPESVSGGAGGWTPPTSATSSGNYMDRFNTGASSSGAAGASAPATPRRENGPYQPGSTSRNGGNFPVTPASNAVQPASTSASVNAGYPSTSYPSTTFPSVDAKAQATPGALPAASPYPSTAPLLR